MRKQGVAILLGTFWLVACSNTPADGTPGQPSGTSQGYIEVQENIDRMANGGYLGAQAIIASGLYSDLSTDDYPFMLMVFMSDSTLETYISEQGLTEETFLSHPKLRSFLEHHLIDSYVDTIKIRSTQNIGVSYTSAADSEVVLTTGDNLNPEKGAVMLANGVPVSPYCVVSGNGGEDNLPERGLLCDATVPIVDFDW